MTFKEAWGKGPQLKEIIDVVISHNEIVELWYTHTDDTGGYHMMFRGMAWEVPDEYLELRVKNIFGKIPEKISESDSINILLDTDENGFTHGLPKKTHDTDGVEEGHGC